MFTTLSSTNENETRRHSIFSMLAGFIVIRAFAFNFSSTLIVAKSQS